MPTRDDGCGEVERDDAMYGKHQRSGDASEDEVGLLVMGPLAVGAAPAHGKDAVGHLTQARGGAVAKGGEVRDEAEVPENQRDGEIGGDRKDVPEERAAEVLPDGVGVRDREKKPGEPDAANMKGRKDAGADHRKDGHRLGRAVDGGPPFLAGEKKNGGDEGAGVADADPENEVSDIPGPTDGNVEAPDADAGGDEIGKHGRGEGGDGAEKNRGNPPPTRGGLLDDPANMVGDPREGTPVADQGLAVEVFGSLGESGLGGGIVGAHQWPPSVLLCPFSDPWDSP